jgi:hypothetical protein
VQDGGVTLASLVGAINYQGTWNANTNTPTLASGVGTKGYYYVVSANGSTSIDGINDWKIGDWIVFNGTTWEKIDNTDAVSSVFGRTGAVVAATNDYTWAQINKATSSIADITTRSHTSLSDIGTNTHANIDTHIANTSNPHSVTASQAAAVPNSTFTATGDTLRGTGAGTYEKVMNNMNASVAPTANEDSGDGYSVGSRWIDTTADKEYICLDSSVGAAVWKETTQLSATPALDDLSDVTITSAEQGDILYRDGSGWVNLHHGSAGQFLATGGHGANPSWSSPAGGGDVLGPASNTDNYVPQWNGTDSKTLKNGLATGNANGAIVLRTDTNDISADAVGEVTAGNGIFVDGLNIKDSGFALGSDADGDIYYRASGALARLAKGTAEQSLKMNSGATAPEWGRVMNPKRHIWIDAGAMVARTTNGAASATVETSTNKQMSDFFDFDKDADENVCFRWAFPDIWDRSTIKVKFYWSASAGTSGTVKWYIQGIALSNDDAIDTAYGTAVGVEDTFIATGDVHVTSATGAVTIGGTPALADVVYFQIYRDVSEDTFDADARLMGVMIEYAEAATDASAW